MVGEQAEAESLSRGVKSKGLTGDDRWFYIEECMSKGRGDARFSSTPGA